MKGGDKN